MSGCIVGLAGSVRVQGPAGIKGHQGQWGTGRGCHGTLEAIRGCRQCQGYIGSWQGV